MLFFEMYWFTIQKQMNTHKLLRTTKTWTSFGKNFNKAPKRRKVKDISDSHLLHIIGHLLQRRHLTTGYDKEFSEYEIYRISTTLMLMLDEAKYRAENKIYIPDYGIWNKITHTIRTIWDRVW